MPRCATHDPPPIRPAGVAGLIVAEGYFRTAEVQSVFRATAAAAAAAAAVDEAGTETGDQDGAVVRQVLAELSEQLDVALPTELDKRRL